MADQDMQMAQSEIVTDQSMAAGAPAAPEGEEFEKTEFSEAQENKERKIDNTQFEAISHKKTLTLINYFILNTSQFLNAFANVSEDKIHAIDEKLDQLETEISIIESKLESLPEEIFEHLPDEPQ